ncbi:alkaline phosphatase D family protein [Methylomonas sp. EFPC3]|uniref:alkaline phosphatase D family protein n=1 Tax=Methylomonas sp. EFPC3 TaxID=3021710 RepID=UPI002415BE7F|nr:alkaline phosphatase D family protein [Methylomonas sp. EFPC3]WFP51143.1 alkaline phosphatase D family protein [Methylomonas sp. EFPC3]
MTITLGPIIGHTTHTSAKIWIRGAKGPNHNSREFCYGAFDLYEGAKLVASQFCFLKDYYDFTGVAQFDQLRPNTTYRVECGVVYKRDADAPPTGTPVTGPVVTGAKKAVATFKTDRGSNDTRLEFVFGSCRYLYWDNLFQNDAEKGDKTFRSIANLHQRRPLDFFLAVGDQVYADPLNKLYEYKNFDALCEIYRKSFQLPHIANLMRSVPTYMILDDHEIRNDWSKDQMRSEADSGFYAMRMRAYASYQHLHNPDTPNGQFWYSFAKGPFAFFVMDTRTLRINDANAVGGKTLLGREQLNAFFDWLHQNRNAPVKFVVSSVPFFPDPKPNKGGDDKWAGFNDERSMILEFIRVEGISDVVFLSGDVHNSSFARMRCYQDPAFLTTSLVSSPFYWPYPHESASDFYGGRTLEFMQWTDGNRRSRDRIEYRYEGEGFIGDEAFMAVSVDIGKGKPWCSAEIFDRKGNPFPAYPRPFFF